jgi:hypothetical protein
VTRPASCHPDRPYRARGLCYACYSIWWWRRKRDRTAEANRRSCRFCGRSFASNDPRKVYCDALCAKTAWELLRCKHRGQEVHVTRQRSYAETLVTGYLERGCRRMRPGHNGLTPDPFVTAWRKGPLFLIRARLPECYGEEAAA